MSSAEALSALIGSALPPAASISFASREAFSSELNQVNATAAPSAASRLTIPSPIPREPPVTRAILPANDRPYFSVMSILQSGPNLSYWIILSRIRFRFLSEPRGWATHDMAVRTKRTGGSHKRGVRLCGERRSRKLTTHAFPTQTFSSLRAKSFSNVLLLSSPCLVLDRL